MEITYKLSSPPASNFGEWERNFLDKIQSSKDYSFLGACLRQGRQLPPNYLFSEVPETFFFQETKEGLIATLPTVEAISMSRSSYELIVRAKAKIMDEMARIAMLKLSLFEIIMGALSDTSKRIITLSDEFGRIRLANEIYELWRLIKKTHLINSIAHSIELENKLQRIRWFDQPFNQFLEEFQKILEELKGLGSEVPEPKAAFLLLSSLRDSRLEVAVANIMFLGEANLPKTFIEAKRIMDNAHGSLSAFLLETEVDTITANVAKVGMSRFKDKPRSCIHCQEVGHWIQNCPIYLATRTQSAPISKKKFTTYSG